jgi:hypothetical protein
VRKRTARMGLVFRPLRAQDPLENPGTYLASRQSEARASTDARGPEIPSSSAEPNERQQGMMNMRRSWLAAALPGVVLLPACSEEVKDINRTRWLWGAPNCPAVLKPTSPQPTIKTRCRRKRAGSVPKGVWFEGKIRGSGSKSTPLGYRKDELSNFCAAQWPQLHRDRKSVV